MTMLLINYDKSYMYNTYSMIKIWYYLDVVDPLEDIHANIMRHIWTCVRTWEEETYIVQRNPLKNT